MSISFANSFEAKELSQMAIPIWKEYFLPMISEDQINYMLIKFQSEKAIYDQIEDRGYKYGFIFNGTEKVGYFAIRPEEDSLFISKIYLTKENRGKGLGSKTLDEILDIGRILKKKRAYLTVYRNNKHSIDVYKTKGFVIAEEKKADIGNGFYMDDYIMEYRY